MDGGDLSLGMYTGGDLEILNDGSYYESRLEEHKYEIMKMVQGRKHVGGMSGDGVNAIDVFVTGVFINPILIKAFGLTLIELSLLNLQEKSVKEEEKAVKYRMSENLKGRREGISIEKML
ncbi:hypothetical protein Tco_0369489 [Tanacetum coccineum]